MSVLSEFGYSDLYKLAHDITITSPDSPQPIKITSGINIDLTIKMNLKTSSSSFVLTVYNLDESKFEKVATGSRVEIILGYSVLFGANTITDIRKTVDIEGTRFVGIVESTESMKDQGDMAYIFRGYDELYYKLKNYDKTFSMSFGYTGATDLSVFVEGLMNKVGVRNLVKPIGQANMSSYSTKKEDSAFQAIKRIALKYGMYFICKNGIVKFVRDIKELNDNNYFMVLDYDNALLQFNEINDEEPLTVELEKILRFGGLPPIGVSRKTDTITTKSYFFKCLGIPNISVGDRLNFVPNEPLSNDSRVKQAVNSLVNVIPRKKAPMVQASIYSIKIRYANRHSGYYMEGKAVDINREEGIERVVIFDSGSEESAVDSILKKTDEKINRAFPLSFGDNTGGRVEGSEISQISTGKDEEIEDDPQASVSKETNEDDLILNVPYVSPFAGPYIGMVLPNITGSRNILANLDPRGLDVVCLGQTWMRGWAKPNHDPDDFLIQNALVNLYLSRDLTSETFRKGVKINNITKFLMSALLGTIGFNAKGMLIKIDPETGVAKFNLTGVENTFTVELGSALIEVDGNEIALTKGLTRITVKNDVVEIT